MERLTIRLKIDPGEALLSLIHRAAKANGIKFLTLLNMLKRNKYRMHSGDSHKIDIFPESVLDVKKVSYILGLEESEIKRASFTNVLRSFKGSSKEVHCRFLNGIIRDHLFYCRDCLSNKMVLNLMWKVKGVDTCLIHKRKLSNECSNCRNELLIKDTNQIGICPYCKYCFNKRNINPILVSDDHFKLQTRIQSDWHTIIRGLINKELNEKEIAIRVLYVLGGKEETFCKLKILTLLEDTKLIHLLQIARGTMKKRTIDFKTLSDYLTEKSTSITEFLLMKVPPDFTLSLDSNRVKMEITACSAPWCENFDVNNSLVQTTSKNVRKKVEVLKRYYICPACGCEYATNKKNELVERSYFINAYKVLSNRSVSTLTWMEREKVFGLKRNKIIRIQAYFYSRALFIDLINESKYSVEANLLESVKISIRNGEAIYTIRHWEKWRSEEEYLLYRYHPQIIFEIFKERYKFLPRQG
ncbi:TniQ family protein [Paenibacillus qinlingensis]|uniref:TniQ family protein n=1 Tax=Paenibacillus qinlingensis TaxID=1837343 RepID=UPI0015631E20|nr:TniQ family protein [Paenibacillus qinlingensis]NQX62206.1 TniQ family protein [Paenibacillus qinlingensis]